MLTAWFFVYSFNQSITDMFPESMSMTNYMPFWDKKKFRFVSNTTNFMWIRSERYTVKFPYNDHLGDWDQVVLIGFDFIECFTTTFLRAHSWLNWVDEDDDEHDDLFDFIECFTTTFLRTHSWLNWVDEDDDEDEVGLKEKPEDTRYIKKITSK